MPDQQGPPETRRRALQQAVAPLMEAAVLRRLGRHNVLPAERMARLHAASSHVVVSSEEWWDFTVQAKAIAADLVVRQWDLIEPAMRRTGGVIDFLGLENWPIDLIEQPLRPAGADGSWTS